MQASERGKNNCPAKGSKPTRAPTNPAHQRAPALPSMEGTRNCVNT